MKIHSVHSDIHLFNALGILGPPPGPWKTDIAALDIFEVKLRRKLEKHIYQLLEKYHHLSMLIIIKKTCCEGGFYSFINQWDSNTD